MPAWLEWPQSFLADFRHTAAGTIKPAFDRMCLIDPYVYYTSPEISAKERGRAPEAHWRSLNDL